MGKLSSKHQQFVNEYLKCWNATRAYMAVYPKVSKNSARTTASGLLKRSDIRDAVAGRLHDNANEVNSVLATGFSTKVISAKSKSSSIYIIRSENGLLKIGISNDPDKRLKALDTASPVALKIYATYETENAFELEQELHRKFSEYNVKGEWFFIPKTILHKMIGEYNFVLRGDSE